SGKAKSRKTAKPAKKAPAAKKTAKAVKKPAAKPAKAVTPGRRESNWKESKQASKPISKQNSKPISKQASAAPVAGKWVYSFGDGRAEGKSGMRDLLGGKGANLAEMANLGLPVPPGFAIPTSV